MKRKVKITFEIEEMTFFKTKTILTAFCEHCGQSVEIQTTESAALFLGLAEFQIFWFIELGNIHFIESDKVYICRNSLEDCAEILRLDLESFKGLTKKRRRSGCEE